jgi:hypothetical protein
LLLSASLSSPSSLPFPLLPLLPPFRSVAESSLTDAVVDTPLSSADARVAISDKPVGAVGEYDALSWPHPTLRTTPVLSGNMTRCPGRTRH